ncbi:discoidin domain-containing protein [bacterium]|nr:discoidin domain-containing protein [bacterium]
MPAQDVTVTAVFIWILTINWTFEDATKRAAAETLADISQYTPDVGSGTINLIGAVFGPPNYFTQGSEGTGTYAAHSNAWNDGTDTKYWQITVSTMDYVNLKLSSKQRSSPTGPRDFKVQYSTDGATWIDIPGTSITVAENFTSGVLDEISLPEDCEGQGPLYLRWIMTSNMSVNGGTVGSLGTNRIDDILLTGIWDD